MKVLIPAAFCFLIYALVVNCRQSNVPPSCNVSKPLEELNWLKTIVADTVATKGQGLEIYQATYKSRTIYSVNITSGPHRALLTLYDCKGTVLCKGYTNYAGEVSDCQSVLDETQGGPLLYSR